MSKGKKYKIPHKYLRKYQRGTWHRYKVMRGKNGEKAKFKCFRHKKLWKTFALCVWIIIMYNRYLPKIDVVISGNKYIVLLWYNKWYWDGQYKRTYIKLFKI